MLLLLLLPLPGRASPPTMTSMTTGMRSHAAAGAGGARRLSVKLKLIKCQFHYCNMSFRVFAALWGHAAAGCCHSQCSEASKPPRAAKIYQMYCCAVSTFHSCSGCPLYVPQHLRNACAWKAFSAEQHAVVSCNSSCCYCCHLPLQLLFLQ